MVHSHKLLRNIDKFLHLIYAELGIPHYRVIRCNMEEIVLKGPHSNMDVRIVNSYPSKVKCVTLKDEVAPPLLAFVPHEEGQAWQTPCQEWKHSY